MTTSSDLTKDQEDKLIELSRLVTQGWVSLSQFGRLVGISQPTAYTYRDKGYIKTTRIGGVYRVSIDEVRRFILHGNRTPAP